MKMKVFVVTCYADPTCIIVAENEKMAVKMARSQANEDLGDCDDNWTAYEINDYFKDDYEPTFYGWVKQADQKYV